MSFLSVTDFAGAGLGAPPHGHHHGHRGHRGGGGRFWGPTYGPGYYDPYWNAPSPYLVILDGENGDDEDTKKKKRKKKLLERLGTAQNWNW